MKVNVCFDKDVITRPLQTGLYAVRSGTGMSTVLEYGPVSIMVAL